MSHGFACGMLKISYMGFEFETPHIEINRSLITRNICSTDNEP